MQGKMAVIGDGDSVLVFSSVGIDAFPVKDGKDAEARLISLAKRYKIIFITEALAKENDEIIKRYLAKPYPIIIPLPSGSGESGYGESLIKSAMEKALGIDILYNKNKDGEDKTD